MSSPHLELRANRLPTPASPGPSVHHRGPSLVAVAGVHAGLFVASLVVSTALAGGAHFPSPFEEPGLSRAYFASHARAVRLAALLQFGAAVPLGIFTAAVTSRLRFLGVEVAGVSIAAFGGTTASVFLAASALVEWVLAQPGIAVQVALPAFHLLTFALGGPGVVVPFGLLIAGVAVSGGLHRMLPRALLWTGVALAVVAELATLSLVLPEATYALPLARFGGFIWLICAGYLLPSTRKARR